MAGGNYLPYPTNIDSEMVYVEFPTYQDDYQWQREWDEVWRTIGDALPESFSDVDKWEHHNLHVFFENALLQVGIADNEWSWAVVVRPVLDRDTGEPVLPGLSYRHIGGIFNRIVEALRAHEYELYKRTGAWTSHKLEANHG